MDFSSYLHHYAGGRAHCSWVKSRITSRYLIYCSLIFLLFSCSTHTSNWEATLLSNVAPISSARIKPTHLISHSGLELELYQYPEQLLGFINLPFAIEKNNELSIRIFRDDEPIFFIGNVLDGNMKVLLDDKATFFLLEALEKNQKIKIEMAGFSQTINPSGFKEKYEEVKKALRIP